jgi:hypothetical protein
MGKIISREYKVMLQANAFEGGAQQFLNAASNFWLEFADAIDKRVGDQDGDLKTIGTHRTISFYDTDKRVLQNNSYIFRERKNVETQIREVTLKFRHQDRYFSQDRNMQAAEGGKTKFEEDIKPVFETLYSFSTTQKISETKNLNKLKDATLLYPGLGDKLEQVDEDEAIEIINGFNAREIVIEGAKFQIGKNPRLDSECALILWYDKNGDDQKPLVAEFSFRYGDKDGEYQGDTARRTYDVFQILQEKLKHWIDMDSKTKTAFAYS